MKNNLTKVLILVLIASNSFLAHEVLKSDEEPASVNEDGTIIREVVTEFSTNVTDSGRSIS